MNSPKCVLTCAIHLHAINYRQQVHCEGWEISVLIAPLVPIRLPKQLEPAAHQAGYTSHRNKFVVQQLPANISVTREPQCYPIAARRKYAQLLSVS